MTLLFAVAAFVIWIYCIHWTRATRAHAPVVLLPLWGPLAVWFIVMIPEWIGVTS